MKIFRVIAEISLKPEVSDIQGQAILSAVKEAGHDDMIDVGAGKVYYLKINASDEKSAVLKAEELCSGILANTIIETFKVTTVVEL